MQQYMAGPVPLGARRSPRRDSARLIASRRVSASPMGVGGPIGVGSSWAAPTRVEERPAEVAGGGGGAAGGGRHRCRRRRARAYAAASGEMRERQRMQETGRERVEGLVGPSNGPSCLSSFLLCHDHSSFFSFSFKYLYMYYSSPSKTPSNA